MEFTIKTGSPAKLKTGLLVLGAFAEGRLPALSAAADGAAEGRIAALIKRGDLDEKAGATLLVHDLPGIHAERVLVVSLGKHDEFGDKAFRDALAKWFDHQALFEVWAIAKCLREGDASWQGSPDDALTRVLKMALSSIVVKAVRYAAPGAQPSRTPSRSSMSLVTATLRYWPRRWQISGLPCTTAPLVQVASSA